MPDASLPGFHITGLKFLASRKHGMLVPKYQLGTYPVNSTKDVYTTQHPMGLQRGFRAESTVYTSTEYINTSGDTVSTSLQEFRFSLL